MRVTNSNIFIVFSILIFVALSPLSARELEMGADLSFVPELEAGGVEYTLDGEVTDPLEIFTMHKFSWGRLRIWHTPESSWYGTDSTVVMAQRIKESGMKFLLDFHYSDTWADPSVQTKPAAWQDLEFETLVDSVYMYTFNVLQRFAAADALPDMVQIGNEIQPGMLWDTGRIGWAGSEWDTDQQWFQFTTLLSAGIQAVHDAVPEKYRPEIMIHSHDGPNWPACRHFFDGLAAYEIDFDVIGLSYYVWWHGEMGLVEGNMRNLANRYNKPIYIVETGYPWTLDWNDNTNNFVGQQDQILAEFPATPQGQAEYFAALYNIVLDVPNQLGRGIMLWEPAWVVGAGIGNPWENLTLFNFDNEALPTFQAFVDLSYEDMRSSVRTVPDYDYEVLITPNPFNNVARITVSSQTIAQHPATIFNSLGRRITQLQPTLGNGTVTYTWHPTALTSGTYFVRLPDACGGQVRALYMVR